MSLQMILLQYFTLKIKKLVQLSLLKLLKQESCGLGLAWFRPAAEDQTVNYS